MLHADMFKQFPFAHLYAQKLLNFQLNRQALAVPTRPERHIIALHGAPTIANIFHNAPRSMADVGDAVERRRTLHITQEAFVRFILAFFEFFADMVFVPELANLLFQLKRTVICG